MPLLPPPEDDVALMRCCDNPALEQLIRGDLLAVFWWQFGKHVGCLVLAGLRQAKPPMPHCGPAIQALLNAPLHDWQPALCI
jgi:hypothetical protein